MHTIKYVILTLLKVRKVRDFLHWDFISVNNSSRETLLKNFTQNWRLCAVTHESSLKILIFMFQTWLDCYCEQYAYHTCHTNTHIQYSENWITVKWDSIFAVQCDSWWMVWSWPMQHNYELILRGGWRGQYFLVTSTLRPTVRMFLSSKCVNLLNYLIYNPTDR